jgi:stage II sporulation protein D
MQIFAGGSLRVTDDTGITHTATGLWHLRAKREQNYLDVVLTLPSERYVAAVLNAEASPNEPVQSLQALAILARTYALNGKHYMAQAGHFAADLCDSTECEAMLLQSSSQNVNDAVRSTAGETLWFGTRRAEVFFSQDCGGTTEDAASVWPSLRGRVYLQSHADPFCVRRDRGDWHAQVSLRALAEIAKDQSWHLPAELVSAQVIQRSASHRVLRVEFKGRDGKSAMISASALRFGIGRALGWNQVRSDAYKLGIRSGALIFDGRGHGHGVGLCQMGATEMASEGKSAAEILAFYFPGTAIRILPLDEGWRETHAGPLTLRTTRPVSTAQQNALQQTWMEARRRFPPRRAVAPVLIFAPSTELFRQLTSQPGWMLASTQGNEIVLQSESVLRADRRDETAAWLHEMLHVAVEAESNSRTPLWLREGLVEVLAGERIDSLEPMSAEAIESGLLHSESQAASKRAHMAAAAKVKGLMDRYGMPVVRGWLTSGAPAGAS